MNKSYYLARKSQIPLAFAMATDRLSALPDYALLHILSFLDVTEAARTSVLSRRWRTLWCQEDAVYLDDGDFDDGIDYSGEKVGRLLFQAAMAIVGARGRCPVKMLGVFVISYDQSDYVEGVMRASPGLDAVLAAPIMQHLEELRIRLEAEFGSTCEAYELPPSRMPCECLRVLKLTGCTLGPPGNAVFGCLEKLRMESCESRMEDLQAMLDAAPNLTSLWLERVSFKDNELGHNWYAVVSKRHGRLRCPASVTDLALIHCHTTDGLDLEAPNVRSLRYRGYIEHFPFSAQSSSTMPNPEHVHVSFCKRTRCANPPSWEVQRHTSFWESIGSFSHVQDLKLKLEYIKDIAVHRDQEDMLLNKVFPNLKSLEVEGSCQVDTYGAAVAIANLLQCCPAMEEFRLKCSLHVDPFGLHKLLTQSEERRAGLEKSMDLLTRLKSNQICPSSDVGYDWRDDMELCALESHSFPCLINHLRKIRLQLNLECFDCFEVKLAKFLVENAMVLEEMEVHDGDQNVHDHIHHKLAEWRANSFESGTNVVSEQSTVSSLDWDRIERGTYV